MCTSLARRVERSFERRGFGLAPLQTPWVRERLGLKPGEPLTEMQVLTSDGRVFGGTDAVVYLARWVWWGWPVYAMAKLPGMLRVLRFAYRWVAERRSCIGGICERPRKAVWPGWFPLVFFPLFVTGFRSELPPWVFMWLLAFSIFAGCKWWTYWQAKVAGVHAGTKRMIGYLLAYPGMDASEFLNAQTRVPKPALSAWIVAAFKIVLGATFFWGIARLVPSQWVLLKGWVGMFGLILLLHFGIFHIVVLLWQKAGVNARHIMRSPILATSLSDFWGKRWNLGFRDLSHAWIFQPSRARVGAVGATILAFLVSGLIHELVISFPARVGYGFPTMYFILQGLGVVVERSTWGMQLGLGRGFLGWAFTLLFAAGPAFWLFHPPFVMRVIIPFMQAMGAL